MLTDSEVRGDESRTRKEAGKDHVNGKSEATADITLTDLNVLYFRH